MPTLDRFDNEDQAFYFDGTDDFVNMGDQTEYQFGNGDFAFSIWIKPDGDATRSNVLGKSNPQEADNFNQYSLWYKNTNGTVNGNVFGNQNPSQDRRLTAETFVDDEWNHLVLSHSNSETYLYVNNVLVDQDMTDLTAASIDVLGYDLVIGKRISLDDFHFKGAIDDIRLFDKNLSVGEVDDLYNETAHTSSTIVSIQNTTCPTNADGIISINSSDPTLQYSLNNGVFSSTTTFDNLTPGTYTISVQTADGCTNDLSVDISGEQCIEICGNGIDDDGNGLTDCEEVDCIPTIAFASSDPTYGSIAQISFNDGTATDDINGYIGTTTGAVPTLDRFDNEDQAFYFDGTDDFVNIGDQAEYQFGASDFSISLWAKPDGDALRSAIINKIQPDAAVNFNQYSIWYKNVNGTVNGNVFGTEDANQDRPLNTDTFQEGEWNHIVMSHSNSTTSLYVNNVLVDQNMTDLTGSTFDITGYPFIIGKRISNDDFHFKGAIDDIRLFDKNLSVGEVDELYNETEHTSSTTVSVQNTTCPTNADGIISINSSDETLQYSLNNGAFSSTTTFENLTPGTYIISVQTADGCTNELSIDISGEQCVEICGNGIDDDQNGLTDCEDVCGVVEASPTTVINASCPDNNNGSITLDYTTDDSSFPITYILNNGTPQTSPAFEDLTPGDYDIIIETVHGCSDAIVVTIEGEPSPVYEVTSTDALCPDYDNGEITIIPEDETEILTYSLDGGAPQSEPVFTDLTPGNYVVSVTNAEGCSTETTIEVLISPSSRVEVIPSLQECTGSILLRASDPALADQVVAFINSDGPYFFTVTSNENGDVQATVLIEDLIPNQIYEVLVSDENNCQQRVDVDFSTLTTGDPLNCSMCSTVGLVNVSARAGTCDERYSYIVASGPASELESVHVFVEDQGPLFFDDVPIETVPDPSVGYFVYRVAQGGSYEVIFKDARGCESIQEVVVPDPIRLYQLESPEVVQPSCPALDDGSITLYFNTILQEGGPALPEYSIDGSAFSTQNVFSNLTSGLHIIDIQNVGGCTEQLEILLQNFACQEICNNGLDDDGDGLVDCEDIADCMPEVGDITSFPPTCPDLLGSVTLEVSNMSIKGGETPDDNTSCDLVDDIVQINNLTPGQHTLTITNDVGCFDEVSVNFPIVICHDICGNGIDDDNDGLVDCADIEDCASFDQDGDTVCDVDDQCAGFDDTLDDDGDGIPDGCDEDTPCDQLLIGNDLNINYNRSDGWTSNMVINTSDRFENTTTGVISVEIVNFNFSANRTDDPLTPFIAQYIGPGDFVILAIGTTLEADSYVRKDNTVPFSDTQASLLLNPGDVLVTGFIDAETDGSDGASNRSVVEYRNGDDDVWHTGGDDASDSGSISIGAPPTAGTNTINETRAYAFNIEICALGSVIVDDSNCNYLDFNDFTIVSYAGNQDNGTATVIDNGETILVEDDAQKAIEVNYTITTNTHVRFDFWSDVEGESHSIGFDNNLNQTTKDQFILYGTKQTNEIEDFYNYNRNGLPVSYTIPVGQYYTGTFQYLVLRSKDQPNAVGTSYFSNVTIYEDANGDGICD